MWLWMRHGSSTMILKPKFKLCSGDIRIHWLRRNSMCSHQQTMCCSVFWDAQCVIMVDYLQRGATITGLYYAHLIHKLRNAIKEKCRGKLRQKFLLHQDNASSHKSLVAMAVISTGFELLDHLPYSPDLAPSDCRLFRKLKEHLRGKKFSFDKEVMLSVNQ